MIEQIKRDRNSISLLIFLTFLMTPVINLWAAMYVGITGWDEIFAVLNDRLVPVYTAGVLTLSTIYFWRFMRPVARRMQQQGAGSLSAVLHDRIKHYYQVYWGLYLGQVMGTAGLFIYSLHRMGMDVSGQSIWNFLLLQGTLSLILGLPTYLILLDKYSQLTRYTGVIKVQNSIHSKLLLLGGLLPVLSYSLLLEYQWLKFGKIEPSSLLIWSVLSGTTLLLTYLATRSLRLSLAPVQQALGSSGAVTNETLAKLQAHYNDEAGYLTQTLGKVFQRLTDQDAHIRAIIDNAAEGIIVTDEQGKIDTFNLAAQKLFQYECAEVRSKPLSWLMQDVINADGSPVHISGRHKLSGFDRHGNELSLSVGVSGVILRGKPVFIYLINDISDTEAALNKLKNAEAQYRDLVETAHDLVWSMDREGHWTYLNNASEHLYGYKPEEMIGMSIHDFQHPDHVEEERAAFNEIRVNQDLYQFETVHRNRFGQDIWLSFNARVKLNSEGDIIGLKGTARDITATRNYQHQLSYQAEHDALTGLYNRRFFQQVLDRLLARVARHSETAALLYIDLDQFKYINDTLGHAAGDQLLIEISNMISDKVREGDLFARFGGDEFTLLLYDIDIDGLAKAAENFRRLFDNFVFHHQGKGFSVSCSIGAALIDASTKTSEEVMSHADLACNIAKTRGRNCVNIYKPEERDEQGMADDMGWAARVRDMIDNNRFHLLFQPIVDNQSGKIVDHEVLLRMPAEDGSSILPGGFLPAAERFGLISNLDKWVIEHSIQRLAVLHQAGNMTSFSINLSDRAIEDHSLTAFIESQLDKHAVKASCLGFEISETAIITNLHAASEFFAQLKDIGCICTLDDFGSGFSSFGYLKDLPVDRIKIDGSVIRNISHNNVDRALVESMNTMARAMNKVIVAEAVEDKATLDILTELGVHLVQGHHTGKPTPDPQPGLRNGQVVPINSKLA